MATKSPTTSVRSHEMIGGDQFTQRREVFDKYDTVFMPLQSPASLVPASEVEPIVTSNHGKTTSNFKRNAPGYSSMRETSERDIEFRPRKYSDNFTSEYNQSDDVDYRYSMTERTRRLSKLRREFLNSIIPDHNDSFSRNPTRASMPTNTIAKYKIESPHIYKFPFAEPYTTPTPVRKIRVDLGPTEVEDGKENQDPEIRQKQKSLSTSDGSPKIDHQKLFEELVKRYSPQRKPVDWTLPPTRPRVVASVPKSISSATDSVDNSEKKKSTENIVNATDDEVFIETERKNCERETENINVEVKTDIVQLKIVEEKAEKRVEKPEVVHIGNGPQVTVEDAIPKTEAPVNERDSKISLTELDEKNDRVPELSTIQRQISRESAKRPPLEKYTDITIPALIEKMAAEGEELEKKPGSKKVKRKRSFLDKLLRRNKNKEKI